MDGDTLALVGGAVTSRPPSPAQLWGDSLSALLREVRLAQARDLARAGRHGAAESLLLQLAQARDASPEEIDLLARIRAQQGRFLDAERCWERARELDPANPAYAAGLARVARSRQAATWLAPLPAVAALLIAAGLVALSVWWATYRLEAVERSVAVVSSDLTAVEQKLDRPAISPTVEPSLAGPVEQALRASGDASIAGLQVRQLGTTVALAGVTPSYEAKEQAEALARGVAGVEAVDSSQVLVSPPATPVVALADAVQRRLAGEPQVAGRGLLVKQDGGNVRLSGTVASLEQKVLAERIVGETPGVSLVDTRDLVVVSTPLSEPVHQALMADGRTASFASLVAVEQQDAGVRLKGVVPEPSAIRAAEAVARGVKGVEWVDSAGLVVEYVVRPGDSLRSIARELYGDETKWTALRDANSSRLAEGGLIHPGTRLVVP